MKIGMLLALGAGLLLAAGLVVYNDAEAVLGAVGKVGWGLVGVIGVRALMVAVAGNGWGIVVRTQDRKPWSVFWFLRWIRESINNLLPVAQVGGDLVGARLLTFWGVAGGLAGATILIDLLVQALAQFLFTMIGLGALILDGGGGEMVRWVGFGLLLAAPALAGFYFSQRLGLFELLERWLRALAGRFPQTAIGGELRLHDNLQTLYRRPSALASSLAVHMLVWFLGVGELWVALIWMGYHPTLLHVLILESLSQAVRGAAFPVPGALGIQEGGYMLFGELVGISGEAALALSLVKRVPDLALGLPGLLTWQVMEGRRLLSRRQAEASF
jgi:putative membrane protein